jgi:hypothetical protein
LPCTTLVGKAVEAGGEEALGTEESKRRVADVLLQQLLEEDWVALEDAENTVTDARGAIHQKQAAGHETWKALNASVGLLVEVEIVGLECAGEGCGLTKAERKAFAGDSVNGARGVADEGDVAGGDATQLAVECDRASWGARELSSGEVPGKSRKVSESFLRTRDLLIRDKGDTYLIDGVGRDVGLAEVAPVDLDELCPWGNGVVLAESDATGADRRVGETHCGGHAGLMAVGSNEIASTQCLAISADDSAVWGRLDALNRVFPVEANAEAGSAIDEKLVENGAADTAARVQRKTGFDGGFAVVKANAAQRVAFGVEKLFDIEAQGGEGFKRIGHKAFAAGLVDGRLHAIDDFDLKTLAGGGDSSGETGGACSYYKDVRLR